MTNPAESQTASPRTEFKTIPVEQIQPNPFNPNQMSEEEFEQYVEEVEHLERLPKPMIVRPTDDGYEIVDGEHGWRAAEKVGLTEVLCEVVDIDGFEARRQCFKRNRGGKDDPVLLGKMFQEMKEEKGLSTRKLADEINVSEGTIRNYLQSAEAAELRNRYTGEPSEAAIAEMTHQQVRTYLRLPEQMRDVWLDAGGFLEDLTCFYQYDLSEIVSPIKDADLYWILQPDLIEFRQSLDYALQLASWRHDHRHLHDIDEFVRPAAELRLPVTVLDHLPVTVTEEEAKAALSTDTWASILKKVSPQAGDDYGLCALVDSAVRLALGKAGVELDAVYDPQMVEKLQFLEEAPDFIRQADFLTLEEKFWLATETEVEETEELFLAVKQATCERLKCQRCPTDGDVRTDCAESTGSVQDTFWECLEQLKREAIDEEEQKLFADSDLLLAAVHERLAESPAICDGMVNDEPAVEVLTQRLDLLEWPEFYFVATLLLHSGSLDAAGERWLVAAVATDGTVDEPSES